MSFIASSAPKIASRLLPASAPSATLCASEVLGVLNMPISDHRFERLLDTVDAICRSPLVRQYRIGYTRRSIQARSDQYYATEWDHLVALADKLTQEEALQLEQELFEEIRDYEDGRSCIVAKYDERCIEGPYRRSRGGAEDNGERSHTVYMAWTTFE